MSFKINENSKGEKLKFAFPADLTFELIMTTPDSTFRIKPGSIYGYFECGNTYRYSFGTGISAQEGYYKIEEAKELVIYSCPLLYGSETFYSQDLTSDIKRLTKKNLEADFKNYPEFLNAIKKTSKKFEGDFTVRNNGNYLINQIYRETISTHR
jgi:hypothetical protein